VDEYREYYPEDDKFYFNYTFGDASKRVYFRSANAGNPGKSALTQSLSQYLQALLQKLVNYYF